MPSPRPIADTVGVPLRPIAAGIIGWQGEAVEPYWIMQSGDFTNVLQKTTEGDVTVTLRGGAPVEGCLIVASAAEIAGAGQAYVVNHQQLSTTQFRFQALRITDGAAPDPVAIKISFHIVAPGAP